MLLAGTQAGKPQTTPTRARNSKPSFAIKAGTAFLGRFTRKPCGPPTMGYRRGHDEAAGVTVTNTTEPGLYKSEHYSMESLFRAGGQWKISP